MITQTMSLMASMYDAIGPGFLLALALPFFVLALGLFVWTGLKRPDASER